MSRLIKSIFCYNSCVVSQEIKQHYRNYTQDYQIYENNYYIITASLDVELLKYNDLLYYYFVNVKNFCKLKYTNHDKTEALFKRKGYNMLCLSEPNILSTTGIPAFIESIYGNCNSVIGEPYHVLSYIHLQKEQTPTNRQIYIAIEISNEFPFFYIAMTQHDLFEMVKRRYLYDTVDIKNSPFVYDATSIVSTKSIEDKYIENKEKIN